MDVNRRLFSDGAFKAKTGAQASVVRGTPRMTTAASLPPSRVIETA